MCVRLALPKPTPWPLCKFLPGNWLEFHLHYAYAPYVGDAIINAACPSHGGLISINSISFLVCTFGCLRRLCSTALPMPSHIRLVYRPDLIDGKRKEEHMPFLGLVAFVLLFSLPLFSPLLKALCIFSIFPAWHLTFCLALRQIRNA